MTHTGSDSHAIPAAGAVMLLDARGFTTADLCAMAASSNSGGWQLTLRNVEGFTAKDLQAIAASGGGRVVFDHLP